MNRPSLAFALLAIGVAVILATLIVVLEAFG